jgi:16S rRNA (uracil1498-N3)-methyltransferase
MSIPLFFTDFLPGKGAIVQLSDETARHVAGVLRMREGNVIRLTSGKGDIAHAVIVESTKKSCTVRVDKVEFAEQPSFRLCIAVSLLKNPARFEWLLEKCAEIGVNTIQPLICKRTEKQQFKKSRSESILKSAMQQSQQLWLTELPVPLGVESFIKQSSLHYNKKYIAHCEPEQKFQLSEKLTSVSENDRIAILIGPEGDFSPDEIQLALQNGFEPVALGNSRLRTETAAVVAAAVLMSAVWNK